MRTFVCWMAAVAMVFVMASCVGAADEKAASDAAGQAAPEKGEGEKTPADAAPAKEPPEGAPKTDREKLSYAIGVNIARSFVNNEIDVDLAQVARAMADILEKRELLMTEVEIAKQVADQDARLRAKRDAQAAEQRRKMEEQARRDQYIGQKNRAEADAFLKENAKKEGVVTTASGLQYFVLKQGEGESPTARDSVVVNYVGTLLDGTEFDSSAKHDGPTPFPVSGRIIRGWTEALQMMKVGSKWKLFIPPDLGYGPRRHSEQIGPNQLLVFEIELVSIQKAPEPKPAPTVAPEPQK